MGLATITAIADCSAGEPGGPQVVVMRGRNPAAQPVTRRTLVRFSALRGVYGAPPVDSYPQQTQVRVALPPAQPTMPNPCAGVPDNAWCSGDQVAPGVTIA